jgi:hypothetical protein
MCLLYTLYRIGGEGATTKMIDAELNIVRPRYVHTRTYTHTHIHTLTHTHTQTYIHTNKQTNRGGKRKSVGVMSAEQLGKFMSSSGDDLEHSKHRYVSQ